MPKSYESLFPVALKKTMEFPQFALNDVLSELRERYLAARPRPRKTRLEWTWKV